MSAKAESRIASRLDGVSAGDLAAPLRGKTRRRGPGWPMIADGTARHARLLHLFIRCVRREWRIGLEQ